VSFNKVTATGYINLLNQLRDIVTEESIATVVINNKGTGGTYVVGDIISLSGGTSTHTATFEVTAVTTGQIDTLRRDNDGAYSVPTGVTGIATTGGGGSGATVDVTYVNNAWVVERETQEANTVSSVGANGTGYTLNDTIDPQAGQGEVEVQADATFNADTVSTGGITAASVNTGSRGAYDEVPANPVSMEGGTGNDDCTLNLTWRAMSLEDGTFEKNMVLKGVGGGSDEIYVGFRTYLDAGQSISNWEVAGFTGHTAANTWVNQPGISKGRHDVTNDTGSFLAIGNSASPEANVTAWIWCSTTHIKVVVKNGTTYVGMFTGWLDRYGTAAEFPYPLYIHGSSSDRDSVFSTSGKNCNLADPWADTSSDDGPAQLHISGIGFINVKNKTLSNGVSPFGTTSDAIVSPAGSSDVTGAGAPVPKEDLYFNPTFEFDDIIPDSGAGAGSNINFKVVPTPETGEDLIALFPATVITQVPSFAAQGQMPGVFWCSAAGATLSSEDVIREGNDIDGDWYIAFQGGTFTDDHMRLCIKKE